MKKSMKIKKSFTNGEISKILHSVSAALTLSPGDNRFRVMAYDRAADAIEHASSEVQDLWTEGNLGSLAGIGTSIAGHLDELFKTGHVKHFTQVLKPFPEAVFDLMDIPGIGPKNAYKLCKQLGISKSHTAVSKLEKAAKSGLIAEIEGFGPDSQAKILKGIDQYRNQSHRLLIHIADTLVSGVIDWMQQSQYVDQINYLGSLRRQAATIGDIDIAVATTHAKEVIDRFTKYPKAKRIIEAGEHSSSILLPGEVQVDLMVQPPAQYGSLLQHFTGSKHHNIALRELALKQNLSLSEYGIRPTGNDTQKPHEDKKLVQFATEKQFYNYLGLDWIPPELREGRGEIEAAKNHILPALIQVGDLKGDLHMHSDFDVEPSHDLGKDSVEIMVKKAVSLKYEYIGLSEHNPSLSTHTNDQIVDIIKRKIEAVNTRSWPIHVFNGLEIDIQPNGKRALPDSALDLLDYAAVSIHGSFAQTKETMTKRILTALDHPKVKFLAHPTGRLLNQRDGIDADWDAIFDFCLKNNKWLEIDGWPNRLDLPDVLVHEAMKKGVKFIIDSDSHTASDFELIKYGVSVARRGWLTKSSVVNTSSVKQMIALML